MGVAGDVLSGWKDIIRDVQDPVGAEQQRQQVQRDKWQTLSENITGKKWATHYTKGFIDSTQAQNLSVAQRAISEARFAEEVRKAEGRKVRLQQEARAQALEQSRIRQEATRTGRTIAQVKTQHLAQQQVQQQAVVAAEGLRGQQLTRLQFQRAMGGTEGISNLRAGTRAEQRSFERTGVSQEQLRKDRKLSVVSEGVYQDLQLRASEGDVVAQQQIQRIGRVATFEEQPIVSINEGRTGIFGFYDKYIARLFEGPIALEPENVRLTNKFIRYMMGQSIIFFKYDFFIGYKPYWNSINSTLSNYSITNTLISNVRLFYNQFMKNLMESNLITLDDYNNWIQICPIFPPFIIDYDHNKTSTPMDVFVQEILN